MITRLESEDAGTIDGCCESIPPTQVYVDLTTGARQADKINVRQARDSANLGAIMHRSDEISEIQTRSSESLREDNQYCSSECDGKSEESGGWSKASFKSRAHDDAG